MRNLCNVHCKLLDDIDLFGKDPELYFKGNAKRTSWVGRIFTVFYAMIYLAFFLYKLIRMIKHVDVDFYQTTTFTGETPSIHLDNEAFYGGFALANPNTLKTFIDDRIYYVEAVYMHGHKEGNDWIFVPQIVELETCQLEKFGKKYRDIFKSKNLENLYCFKNMDYMMEGHTTYDVYSYFDIKFYPCVNTTENNFKCKPMEEIINTLSFSMVSVKIQDIELTPENYDKPTEIRGKELSSPAFLNLYENIQAYFHIVHVETDIDFIGFELFKNIQTKTYFKYDGTFIIPVINSPEKLLTEPHNAYCQISIQLTEQILTLKRTNTKLTEVLGEVGGLMEVVFSLFRILSSFLTDNLYEQSLVNHLFTFDLDKKIIKLKNQKRKNLSKKNEEERDLKIYSTSKISPSLSPKTLQINDEFSINTKNKLSDEGLNKASQNNNDNQLVAHNVKLIRGKRKYKTKVSFSSNLGKFNVNDAKNDENDKNNKNEIVCKNFIQSNSNFEKEVEMPKNNRYIVDRVRLSNWSTCCCFLCARKLRNMQNTLLDEGMKIIMQKLDILYLFNKIVKEEKMERNYDFLDIQFDISEEGKEKLHKMYNSYFGLI